MSSTTSRIACLLAILIIVPVLSPSLLADEPETVSATPNAADPPTLTSDEFSEHPLESTLRYAVAQGEYIRDNIRDYTCRLIKRERIDGVLQGFRYANVKVRCGYEQDGQVVEPMSLFMRFLRPKHVHDRRVLYVEGEHEGMILVRKGGLAMPSLKLKLNPDSPAARRESNYSVTELGFAKMIERLIQIARKDIELDPSAANTRVSQFEDAKVGERLCTHIQVEHPELSEGLRFHRANLYIDDELRVPIRLIVYGWPENEGEPAPVIEEYTYVNLQLNVGLTDEDFSKTLLD